jgi:3'-phosphoadenosine 5'-phosphosulfate sulfotransferase (PAPS reductase)/FAD synthetase
MGAARVMVKNIISISGGKDSTATALLAIAMEADNLELVFADTGNEHVLTYDYVDYLQQKLDLPIRKVKADFTVQIERKKRKLEAGELVGWTDKAIAAALELLVPTGNPFLDMCLWKGRFPSSQARFCTQHLKTDPITYQVFFPLLDVGHTIWSWQGIRRDESLARRYAKEFEDVGGGLFTYRPIARWSVESVFEAHRYMGVKPNPLYKMGMTRVGCMPCVNCSNEELPAIALRCPEEVERVREWERLASIASRRQSATFFTSSNDPMAGNECHHYSTHGIDRMIKWSSTSRGGRQFDLIASNADPDACRSAYGLCDGL